MRVEVVRSNALWIPSSVGEESISALRSLFTHPNPAYDEAVRAGRSTRGVSPLLRTYSQDGRWFRAPLGGEHRALAALYSAGVSCEVVDRTALPRIQLRSFDDLASTCEADGRPLRHPQMRVVELAREHRRGIFRVATGVGKTGATVGVLADQQARALVLVPDRDLLNQWVAEVRRSLGVEPGVVGYGKFNVGDVTVALPDTLARSPAKLAAMCRHRPPGVVVVDECQNAAAAKYADVLSSLPAARVYGFSADHTRSDGMHVITEDVVGPVLLDVSRDDAVRAGYITPITVRIVHTGYRDPDYTMAKNKGRARDAMLDKMMRSPSRMQVLDSVISEMRAAGHLPGVVFAHRREFAAELGRRYGVGVMRGSKKDAREYDEVKQDLVAGAAELAAATVQAFGVGKDVPGIVSAVVCTPYGRDARQLFDQLCGRVCRSAPGKTRGYVYYLVDSHLRGMVRRLCEWAGATTRVEEFRDGAWRVLRAG